MGARVRLANFFGFGYFPEERDVESSVPQVSKPRTRNKIKALVRVRQKGIEK